MPDIIDEDGLQVKTAEEISAELNSGLQAIYGADINLDQNSPDGQLVGIITQAAVDLRELITGVNNGFNPDLSQGVVLDQRVTINNIAREGGTYTVQPIEITVDSTVELAGLDGNYNDPNATGYTVQDGSGNQFILADTTTFLFGTTTANFRAKEIGAVNVPTGTITTPVTIVIGVTNINNPSAAISVGQDQETDSQLRTRREQSVALASSGYLNGLLGTVLNLDGVTEAVLYENFTNVTDANGIPPHAIWLVVAGGANSDIGNSIYEKKSYGCNMRGDVEVTITTASDVDFVAKFDRPTAEDLHIRFEIQPTVDGFVFDQDAIKSYMVANLEYNIGEYAETSVVTSAAIDAIAAQGGGGVPLNVEISRNGSDWFDYLEPTNLDYQWTLDVSRITITEI